MFYNNCAARDIIGVPCHFFPRTLKIEDSGELRLYVRHPFAWPKLGCASRPLVAGHSPGVLPANGPGAFPGKGFLVGSVVDASCRIVPTGVWVSPGTFIPPRFGVQGYLFCFVLTLFSKGQVMAADKLLGAISVAFCSRNGRPRPSLRCFWVKMKQNSMKFNSIDLCVFTDFYMKKDLFFLSSAEQIGSPQGSIVSILFRPTVPMLSREGYPRGMGRRY